MTTPMIVMLIVGLVAGWLLHMVWDYLLDWMYDVSGAASSLLWDVCAIIGVVVVCVGLGWSAVHYHWFG